MLEHQQKDNDQLSAVVRPNISLHDKNWFATGGPARYFATPQTPREYAQTMVFAQEKKLSTFILGSGANCLISDDGFDGLVIHPQLVDLSITHDGDTSLVQAGAGVTIPQLIEYTIAHNATGLEVFSGIPGTVGGAVYINLHYFEALLGQFLVQATLFDTTNNSIITVDADWFEFGYDYSKLHERKHVLLDATFALTQADDTQTAYARGRSYEIIRHRNARYPHKNTCGSFFRNFHDHEVTHMSNGKKMIYAAYYLDKIGAKGSLSCGNAIVSHQHANMIVNQGNATTHDIIQLARTMQELVHTQFSITLQPECQLIGFDKYPLHKAL